MLLALLLCGAIPALAAPKEQAEVSAAINFSALQPGQQAVLAVEMNIADGLHAQSYKPLEDHLIPLLLTIKDTDVIEAFAPIYPEPHIETYPALGKVSVNTGRVVIYVPLQVKPDVSPGPITIAGELQYQLCDDQVCFSPQFFQIEVQTQIVTAGQPVEPNRPELFAGFDPAVFSNLVKPPAAAQQIWVFGQDLNRAPLAFILFAAFIIGMIFNIMPCVLPVVPLKAMSFYEVSQHNRGKCLLLGATFSAGIIATFAVLAMLVVVMRTFQWGELFSVPWFLAIIVGLLVIFALQMFGVFEFVLPQAVYSARLTHESYFGNFLFGIFTAILSTPCTFGLFLGLLIWASAQPSWMGVTLLMVVGMGMAFPYLLLSAVPELARRIPRSGPWTQLVKQMMGFLLLASAVYFSRAFLAEWTGEKLFWWALFGVVAGAGVFLVLRTIEFSRSYAGPVVAAVIALLFVTPALAFTLRVTNPPIEWRDYSQEALVEARRTGRPVMVEFTAAWCGNCLALEATVFHDEQTVETIRRLGVIPLKADLTRPDAPGWQLLRQISPIGAIPLTAIYAPDRDEPIQLSGIFTTDQLVKTLSTAAGSSVASR